MAKILMLSGFHGSGKDTLARLIIDKYPNYKRYAFADKVKDIASQRYNFNRELANMPDEKDKPRSEYNGQSIRDLVRTIFEEVDKTNINLVVDEIAKNITKDIMRDTCSKFIITDYREEANYQRLVDIFGKQAILTIYVTRQNIIKPDKQKEPEEYRLLNNNFSFDITIKNDTDNEPESMLNQIPYDLTSNYICDKPKCRYCLEDAGMDDNLIKPCMCKGTNGYVHRNCLDTWRQLSQNPSSAYQCQTCECEYKSKHILPSAIFVLFCLICHLYKYKGQFMMALVFLITIPMLLFFHGGESDYIKAVMFALTLFYPTAILIFVIRLWHVKLIKLTCLITFIIVLYPAFPSVLYYMAKPGYDDISNIMFISAYLYPSIISVSYVFALKGEPIFNEISLTYQKYYVSNTVIQNV